MGHSRIVLPGVGEVGDANSLPVFFSVGGLRGGLRGGFQGRRGCGRRKSRTVVVVAGGGAFCVSVWCANCWRASDVSLRFDVKELRVQVFISVEIECVLVEVVL